ncbi:MAG TPA: FHA domain-containing protein [Vicinamibacteria bacterium]|nr:FHA domain-containing protein [Vicinamibacteria bacterium]
MAKIVVLKEGEVELERELGSEPLSIGRDPANDITLADSAVSRRHARIETTSAEGYRIVDLESGNGILHQGRRCDSLDLYPGCEVTIGGSVLRFESNVALPTLVLIGGAPPRSYPLLAEETVLGRAPGSPIAIPDPLVSSRHLKIVRRGEVYAAVDLESGNGTRVNGVKVTSRELKQGDQIQIGGFTFYFALDGVVPAPESIQIIQPVHTPSTPPGPPSSASAPSPAARTPLPPAKTASSSSSRPRLLLIAAGLGVVLFLLVVVILVRSPDQSTEREFQEVFQADLNAEEKARIEEYLTRAKDYEAAGNLSLALEQYQKVLVLDQTHHQAQAETARLEEAAAAEAQTRAERERLDRERSAQVASFVERATKLQGEAKFDEATTVLEEAKALSPDSDFVKKKLVESHLAEGNYFKSRNAQRARAAYEQALALDPDNAAARQGLSGVDENRRASRERQKRIEDLTAQGLSQLQKEDFQSAYASFSGVLKLDPQNARAREFRDQASHLLEAKLGPMYDEGVRLYNAGELAPAMAQFQRVLDLNPDHAATKAFMGNALGKVRSEAVDVYKRAYIYEGLGKLRDARDLYRQCLALLPNPREEYHQKAQQRIADLDRKLQ